VSIEALSKARQQAQRACQQGPQLGPLATPEMLLRNGLTCTRCSGGTGF
jgi:hypothetical protein